MKQLFFNLLNCHSSTWRTYTFLPTCSWMHINKEVNCWCRWVITPMCIALPLVISTNNFNFGGWWRRWVSRPISCFWQPIVCFQTQSTRDRPKLYTLYIYILAATIAYKLMRHQAAKTELQLAAGQRPKVRSRKDATKMLTHSTQQLNLIQCVKCSKLH